jgi:hypothetical protein
MLLELKGPQMLDDGLGVWDVLVCIVQHWKSEDTGSSG